MLYVTLLVPPEDAHPCNLPIRRPYSVPRLREDGRAVVSTYVEDLQEVSWYWPTAEVLYCDDQRRWGDYRGKSYGTWNHIDPDRIVVCLHQYRHDSRTAPTQWRSEHRGWPKYLIEEEEGDEFPIYFE